MKPLILFWRGNLRKFRELGPVGLLGVFWATMPALAGIFLFIQLGAISDWLHAQGGWGLLIFGVAFMVGSGLGLLPTTAQSVLGGWVFGPWWGMAAAAIGYVGAASLGLLITRCVAGRRIERLIEARPAANAIRHALLGKGFFRTIGMIALLRMPPQAPFAFTNLLMVSCGAKAAPFVIGTVIGMIPRTLTLMLFASAAARTGAYDIQSFIREGPGWMVAVAGFVAMTGVIMLIGFIARQALKSLDVDPAKLR
jgi:uncharacterized membrane protein YdjX (TVP38/TMEM64 family)